MAVINLSGSTRLRFPNRGSDFAHGVEIGMIAALMDMPLQNFTRKLSAANLEQIRVLAEKMGFRLEERPLDEAWTEVTFLTRPARPRLALVHSAEPARA